MPDAFEVYPEIKNISMLDVELLIQKRYCEFIRYDLLLKTESLDNAILAF